MHNLPFLLYALTYDFEAMIFITSSLPPADQGSGPVWEAEDCIPCGNQVKAGG